MYMLYFVYSSVDGYFGCFYLLAIENSVALNMVVQICHRDPALNYFGYIPRIKIPALFGLPFTWNIFFLCVSLDLNESCVDSI